MNDAPPEKIEASDEDLRSLCHGLVGYGLSGQQGKAWGVWLLRRNLPPLLAVSDSRDIVFKFEVFTLALRTPEEVLSAASENRSRMADTLSKLNDLGMTALPLLPLEATRYAPGRSRTGKLKCCGNETGRFRSRKFQTIGGPTQMRHLAWFLLVRIMPVS
jgi:hypothetical protein